MKNVISILGITGALVFIAVSIWGGLRLEDYSEIRQYISESYAKGIAGAEIVRYGFVASGMLLALFCFLSPLVLPKTKFLKSALWGIGLFYGLGTVITGIFPCDIGCDPELESASLSQFIHNFSASLTYMTVPFCLVAIGVLCRNWKGGKTTAVISLLCGIIAACFVLVLFSDPFANLKGLYQRIIEGSILFWVLYMAYYIKFLQIR